jgi:hypothetical protein
MRESAPGIRGTGLCRVDGPDAEREVGAIDTPNALQTFGSEGRDMRIDEREAVRAVASVGVAVVGELAEVCLSDA